MEYYPKRIEILHRVLAIIMVLTIVSYFNIIYATAENIGDIITNIPEPSLSLNFSNDSDLLLNGDASIADGALVLTGKADSNAVFNNDISALNSGLKYRC